MVPFLGLQKALAVVSRHFRLVVNNFTARPSTEKVTAEHRDVEKLHFDNF